MNSRIAEYAEGDTLGMKWLRDQPSDMAAETRGAMVHLYLADEFFGVIRYTLPPDDAHTLGIALVNSAMVARRPSRHHK